MDFEIKCLECGRAFQRFLTNTHLKSHGLTIAQYRERHGDGSDVNQKYREDRSRAYSGSGNPMAGRSMASHVKEALRAVNSIRPPHNKGKRVEDPAILARMRDAMAKREARYRELGNHPHKGKIVSEETREKLRVANLGRKASQETRDKLSAAFRGRPGHTKGKKLSPEHAAKSRAVLIEVNRKKSADALERKLEFVSSMGLTITDRATDSWAFRCQKGHAFVRHKMMLDSCRYRDDFCPTCHPRDVITSKAELEVLDFVRSLMGGAEVRSADRSIIPPLELDVHVPSRRLAIEYCGLYWHSEQAGKDRLYHRSKLEACRAAGIRLITLFEDEWLNRRTIVESHLRHALGLTGEKLSARDCTIEVLGVGAAREFVDAHHLQGYSPSSVRLGLVHDGSLVSAMTFSRPSRSKGSRDRDGWEISRHCSSASVRGGTSRLVTAFVREHGRSLFTFSDLRWGEGSSYAAAGMVRVADTAPGYWYVPPGSVSRIHRFALRKGALPGDDPSMTEFEQRDAQGYLRVWDCGNAKYELIPASDR